MSFDLNDIRKEFLQFFEKNNHKILPSDSLIPLNADKSVLFTNSGMMQFKNFFTGAETPIYERIATSQKCLRAGGKHNDLENVGWTNRHHTFFEMLGNFSFGSYFKEEAICFAWEFLTKNLNLDKSKLYFTVYDTDLEAFNLWKKITGCSDDRITKIATDDNFWSMGDVGPCGPCSEIFYDLGENALVEGGNLTGKVGENDRYIEIWNLVFMQFEKDINLPRNEYKKLPKPCVDTGMGLERISAVLSGKSDNYDGQFFKSLIDEIKKTYGVSDKKQKEDKKTFYSLRILADHIRAVSFLIADGILPDKTGRGYVLRRIIRRAMRYAHYLNDSDILFYKLFDCLLLDGGAKMANYFTELDKNKSLISSIIFQEEEDFKNLLKRGVLMLEEETAGGKKDIAGETAFKLYDTFGFPLDLTKDFARENGLQVDENSFEKLMQKQQEMAKANWKGGYAKDDLEKFAKIEEELNFKSVVHSKPLYYDGVVWLKNPDIVALIDENFNLIADQNQIEKIVNYDFANISCYKLIFKETVCYPEGGGQSADEGFFRVKKKPNEAKFANDSYFANLTNVQKCGSLILHTFNSINITKCNVADGDLIFSVLASKRDCAPKNHTATHLLQAALRQVLGSHVMQKGSNVHEDGLRFDFTHNKALTSDELAKVENLITEWINKECPVKQEELSKEEANKKGALCFFEDKYGEKVRVIEVLDKFEDNKPISIEFCGGTHVKNTKEIEDFMIIKESAVASGIRRIEAISGHKAFAKYWNAKFELEKSLSQKLTEEKKDLQARLSSKEEALLRSKIFTFNAENLEEIFQNNFENIVLKNILRTSVGDIKIILDEIRESLKRKESVSVLFADGYADPDVFRQICLTSKGKAKSALIAMIYKTEEKGNSLFVNILKASDSEFDCKKVMNIIFKDKLDKGGNLIKSKFGGIDSNLQGRVMV